MKTKKIVLSLFIASSLSINGIAQDPVLHHATTLAQDLGQTLTFASTEMGFDTKIVKGAPFSAEIINEFTQVLQDGNRIERVTKGNLYRDSEGRTRRETEFRLPFRNKTSDEPNEPQRNISIFDAVTGETSFFNPYDNTFRSSGLRSVLRSQGVGSSTAYSNIRTEANNVSLMAIPKPIKRVPPVYPDAAKAAGAVGQVKVQVTVGDDGKVIEVKALSGHPLLRDAAIDAAKQWEFPPIEANNKSINRQASMTFNFSNSKLGKADLQSESISYNSSEETATIKGESIKGIASPAVPLHSIVELASTIELPANIPAFAKGDVKKESLGTQMIEGVEAEGSRIISVIPAGAMGNINPIEVVSERWYSKKLQTVIMSKTVDPRIGTTIYRLTNINQGEPDPSLFQIPEADKKNN